MADEHRLDLYNTSGAKQAEIVNFHSLDYSLGVNEPGILNAIISADHDTADSIADKWHIEAWRRNVDQGIGWTSEFYGLVRDINRIGNRPGVLELECPGILELLAWRRVAWPAETDDRSEFVSEKAETVMKTMVDYNIGANATTANGRVVDGTIANFTINIETDGAGGNTIDHYCAYDVVLDSLQDVAAVGGGDFNLVKTAATTFEFRWYTGQLGTDRTATVTFSEGLSNLADPVFSTNRRKEKTLIIVGGPGEAAERWLITRQGDNHSTSNDMETFINASSVKTLAGLQARGDREADKRKATEALTFKVIQTPGSLYGTHYFLGDLVTVINPYSGASSTYKVQGLDISVRQGQAPVVDVRMDIP